MEDKKLLALKCERSILRQFLTKKQKISSDDIDYDMARTKIERLNLINTAIHDILYESSLQEDEWTDEIETCEKYKDIVYEILKKEEKPVASSKETSTADASYLPDLNMKRQCGMHLPKLEFQRFDGSIANWISFWGQFRRIHENDNLDDEVKFQYLLQFVDGKAKQFVLV